MLLGDTQITTRVKYWAKLFSKHLDLSVQAPDPRPDSSLEARDPSPRRPGNVLRALQLLDHVLEAPALSQRLLVLPRDLPDGLLVEGVDPVSR